MTNQEKACNEAIEKFKDWKLKPDEKNEVHAIVEPLNFDPVSGDKLSTPFINCYNPNAWLQFLENQTVTGLVIHKVLHLPKGSVKVEEFLAQKKRKEEKLERQSKGVRPR